MESDKEKECKKAISEYIAKSIRALLDNNCIQALTLFDEIVIIAGYWEENDEEKLEKDEENYEDTEKEKAWDEKYGKVFWRVKRWVINWDAILKEWVNPTHNW